MPPTQNLQSAEIDDVTIEYGNTVKYLRAHLPSYLAAPKLAIICGSGLGGLVNTIEQTKSSKIEFSYSEIPGFVKSTVEGHAGKLVFGLLGVNKMPVVCMVGRFHMYEGHTKEQVTLPIKIFKLLGIEVLIVTNAAGSLNSEFKVGNVVIIWDHISIPGISGNNPLAGPNQSQLGPRFPPMSDAYDFELRRTAFRAAASLKLEKGTVKEGTYCWVMGPSYETRAEAKFLNLIGGDVVGMSTVPEVVVARYCGIRVLGLSLVTNMVLTKKPRSADPEKNEPETIEVHPSHQEVLEASHASASMMQSLVKTIVEMIYR
ncbi:6987_t:CDS:2 [Ambispora gerdemannii]|uniref:Purine nucleoside phosphorylase n=1 Tax=Ambispora gerdemannii TaxID=144530 RepID=A0A9N9DRC3_9GLOM|nr:6987_t:CDS:2 [Ambispora gerdemannii]